MKVDHILILAAGKGTRMGEIGKILPKVIWPIFDKSILELEVDYANEITDNAQIYINTYNYKEKLIEFIKNKIKNVRIVEETEELDVGGAVHNLAKKLDYKGNLLILNCDQFLICDKDVIQDGLKLLSENDSVLFTFKVNSSDKYNALKIEDSLFKGVIKNPDIPRDTNIITYTGMSLVKLDALRAVSGKSRFFESVANFSHNSVRTKLIDDIEYWDFGTLDLYYKNIFKLKDSASGSKFYNFLKKNHALEEKSEFLITEKNILIDGQTISKPGKNISYQGIIENLSE